VKDNRELIVSGSLRRAIFSLAGPAVASMLMQAAFGIVDMIWVGKLGPSALAALSTGGFLIWSVFAITHMIAVGITSMTARFVGADLYDEAKYIAGQGLILSVIISFVVMNIGLNGSEAVFGIMETAPDVTELGLQYLRIIFLGIPTIFLFFAMNSVYRGFGDTKTPMLILFISVVSNIILDPFLIFGWGPFPAMGVEGAALATVICRGLGLLVGISILLKRSMLSIRLPEEKRGEEIEEDTAGEQKQEAGISLKLGGGVLDTGIFWRMVVIGAPTSISGFLFCMVYILLTRFTTDFGTEAVAALGIGHKAESVSYMSTVGFAMAASTIVGQNLGAGNPDRAAKGAWMSLLWVSHITLFCGLMFVLVPEAIVGIFNKDPLVMEAGKNYLIILALSQVFMGAEIVFEGAFSGAGDTIPPMLIATPLSIARIPLAYWLAFHVGMGVSGIWWSISVTSILKGILLLLWFLRGKWKEKTI
jgi:Na+-driven multidrug efflux pump